MESAVHQHEYTYQVLPIPSGQVGYIAIGEDFLPPMILIVGYSGNLLHWNKQFVLELAKYFRVYLPDNRLVGETKSNNENSINGMADDVAEFIDAMNLQDVKIVGWSMGGIIAQNLAMNYPDKVTGISLLGSLPDYTFTHGSLHDLVTNLREKPSKENRDKLMQLFYSEELSIDFRKYLAQNTLRIPGYIYPFNQDAQALQSSSVEKYKIEYSVLEKIVQKTLIFTAKNDLVNKPEASHLLHNLIPNSQLVSYANGGHFFVNYHPISVAEHIINYFGADNLC